MNFWLPGEMMGVRDREFGMDMYILLYLEWITNKDLLYSAWNMELCSMLCGSLDGRGVWERVVTCI